MGGFGPMDPGAGAPVQMETQTVNSGQAMPDPTGGILAGAGISGVSGLIGAGLNLYSAAQNRKWQEKMANTTWQRGVADMKAAGINPLFAFAKGGAPMPSSPAPQVNDLGLDAVGAGVSSAAQARLARYKLVQTMNQTDQQIEAQHLQNKLTQAELERQQLVTAQLQNDVDLTSSQKEAIDADKARAKQYEKIYEYLGPGGSVIFDLLRDWLGKGGTGVIRGPWSGSSAARRERRPIVNSGGQTHDDTSGVWDPSTGQTLNPNWKGKWPP